MYIKTEYTGLWYIYVYKDSTKKFKTDLACKISTNWYQYTYVYTICIILYE